MLRLLRGDFIRLFKSRIFLLSVFVMFGLSAYAVFVKWSDSKMFPDYFNPPDHILFSGTMYLAVILAVFIGIFIGTDHSFGTIRSKAVIGHSRAAVYVSNLIVCTAAGLIMYAVSIGVVIIAACMGITRKFEMSPADISAKILINAFAVSAITAILSAVSMLITSRTAGVVTAAALSFAMIIAANTIDYRLMAEEYMNDYEITVSDDGGIVYTQLDTTIKNPKYLTGIKRKIFSFAHDFLPVDQIMQSTGETQEYREKQVRFPLYSLSLIAAVTTAGILCFGKKDLK